MKNMLLLIAVFLGLASCTSKEYPLGHEKNPVKLFFVPSVEAKTLEDNSKVFKKFLEANTPYKFRVSIPMNYITVVEAFGTKRADVAALNPFGYILAHQKHGAEARMTVVRYGMSTYRSQIVARTESGIEKLGDIEGKTMAFVDPASTSGYMMPTKLFKERTIKPAQTVFAKKHDNVISMVYPGQADAGATFYSPPEGGEIQDARRLVKTQYPDVEKKVKIIELTEPIPNDPIVFRKGMSEDMKQTIIDAFNEFIKSEEGKASFKAIYGVTGLVPATDQDYNVVRDMLKAVGSTAADLIKN